MGEEEKYIKKIRELRAVVAQYSKDIKIKDRTIELMSEEINTAKNACMKFDSCPDDGILEDEVTNCGECIAHYAIRKATAEFANKTK